MMRTTCNSPLTFAEVLDNIRGLKVDPACQGRLHALVDLSTADLVMDGDQLRIALAELNTLRPRTQFDMLALVATRDAMYGMMRMFEVIAAPYFGTIRVFRVVSEAEAWLASPSGESGLGG